MLSSQQPTGQLETDYQTSKKDISSQQPLDDNTEFLDKKQEIKSNTEKEQVSEQNKGNVQNQQNKGPKQIQRSICQYQQEDQESQEQEALEESESQQHSEDQEYVQDQYPLDYNVDQDTYFQKSIKQVDSDQNNVQDQELSEWPLPTDTITKLKQDEEVLEDCQTPMLHIHKIMSTQEFIDFINKAYLKRMHNSEGEESSDDENHTNQNNNVTNCRSSVNKKVMFKASICIKRFNQNDEVNLIGHTIEQSQCLNNTQQTKNQPHSARKQNIVEIDKKSRQNQNKDQKSRGEVKSLQKQNSHQIQDKQNSERPKQNQVTQNSDFNSSTEKHQQEDNFIEIWSSLQGRSIKLIK